MRHEQKQKKKKEDEGVGGEVGCWSRGDKTIK